MTKEELVSELNWFSEKSEPQSEENIVQLYFHYVQMFQEYVGDVPDFEIIDSKGRIKLL